MPIDINQTYIGWNQVERYSLQNMFEIIASHMSEWGSYVLKPILNGNRSFIAWESATLRASPDGYIKQKLTVARMCHRIYFFVGVVNAIGGLNKKKILFIILFFHRPSCSDRRIRQPSNQKTVALSYLENTVKNNNSVWQFSCEILTNLKIQNIIYLMIITYRNLWVIDN